MAEVRQCQKCGLELPPSGQWHEEGRCPLCSQRADRESKAANRRQALTVRCFLGVALGIFFGVLALLPGLFIGTTLGLVLAGVGAVVGFLLGFFFKELRPLLALLLP